MADMTIKLNLDKTPAEASSKQFHAQERQRIAETADAQAKAVGRVRDAHGRFTKDAADGLGKVAGAANATGQAVAGAGTRGAKGFVDMGLASGLAEAGMRKIIDLAGTAGQAFTEAGRKAREMTAAFSSQRDDLRELAVLMGKPLDDKFTLDFSRFNKEIGARPEEGQAFLTELYNAGAAYKGKTISDAEFDEFAKQFGALGVAKGIPAAQAGEMGGTILGMSDYTKFGERASEEATAKGNVVLSGLGRGKGQAPVLARAFNELASASLNENEMMGVFQSPEDVASVISIAAEKSPAGAAELARAGIRGMRKFDDEKTGPLLKKAKITPQTGFIQAVKQLEPIITAEATAGGVKTEDVLAKYFADDLTKEALSVFINKGVLRGGFEDRAKFMAENEGTGKAAGVISEFQRSKTGRQRMADADVKLAEMERGAKDSEVQIVRQQATADLVRNNRMFTGSANMRGFLAEKLSFGMLGPGEQLAIDEAANKLLKARAPAGVNVLPFGDTGAFTPEGRTEQLRKEIEDVRRGGADPLGELPQLMKEQNGLLVKLVENTAKPDKPAPLPNAQPRVGGRGDPQ